MIIDQANTHRNVSQAAINTFNPFCNSQNATLLKFVLFPTPLTPTKVMLYGILCWVLGSGEDNLVRIDRSRSVDVFGVRIRVMEDEREVRNAAFVAENQNQRLKRREAW